MISGYKQVILLYFLAIVSSTYSDRCGLNERCVERTKCTVLHSQKSGDQTTMQLPKQCSLSKKKLKVCCPEPAYPYPLLPDWNTCGIMTPNKIYGGTLTDIDEHPWMALIKYQNPDNATETGFLCGGVLISSRYVLTAAHCVTSRSDSKRFKITEVRLGEWDISKDTDCIFYKEADCSLPVQNVQVEEVIAHEDYVPDDEHQLNDIALLRLSDNVTFNDFVKPICLPTNASLRATEKWLWNQSLEVAGWGETGTIKDTGALNNVATEKKEKVDLSVFNKKVCKRRYALAGRQITNKQLCAGGGKDGKDTCKGDSGGPLMTQVSGSNWVSVGVVSYGPQNCSTTGWPGVYTKVSSYIDWILSKLRL
ncbi:CLIP domain-containing serine protease 2-like [Pararge aegeria]|uniref:CLIP domain-containing serine protease 2-like n=1 Tax=Pararge aegeria TaxID=116150 RepID=UPI0019D1D459|nr:CLIP domain-containing serine protease 2-like [Pararge aegeria]